MELDMQTIGARIKNRRKELKLTQTDIKAAVGISSGNISDIENGNRLPAASTLVQLAEALQCSIDWMLTGASPEPENSVPSEVGDSVEADLLKGFRQLDRDDQDEIMGLLELKLRRVKRNEVKAARSSALTDGEGDHMAV